MDFMIQDSSFGKDHGLVMCSQCVLFYRETVGIKSCLLFNVSSKRCLLVPLQILD